MIKQMIEDSPPGKGIGVIELEYEEDGETEEQGVSCQCLNGLEHSSPAHLFWFTQSINNRAMESLGKVGRNLLYEMVA